MFILSFLFIAHCQISAQLECMASVLNIPLGRKANELDSSDSGGSMEPATRRPAPGPLPAQAKESSAQGPVVLPTASTGEQAAFSGR
jgi:hypothetical protein